MARIFVFMAVVMAVVLPVPASSSEADIDATSRSVVRVVILNVGRDGGLTIRGHGTGFAVTGNKFVTNAHVIKDAAQYVNVVVGIVPPKGDQPTIAKLVNYNPKRDLALIEVPENLNLPAVTFVSNFNSESADAIAVGYPGVVDSLTGADRPSEMIKPQPPTKGRGAVSQQREVNGVRHVLHSAAIARGNSGGPLLDDCGRVIGVNSFSTRSSASEGEFFFAIANSETQSFLRSNDVSPKVSDLPCRSLAEIAAEESAREQAKEKAADEAQQASDEAEAVERARIMAQIQEERENMMALAAVLLLLAAGGGVLAYQASGAEGGKPRAIIFGGIAVMAAVGAAYSWIQRPSMDSVDARLNGEKDASFFLSDLTGSSSLQPGMLTCTLDTERSRVTTSPPPEVDFEWKAEGCHDKTQYEASDGVWSRVFVPTEDYMVRVATIDLEKGEFRNERYLLPKTEWQKARDTRMNYQPPSCGDSNASNRLADMQGSVFALLPDEPNERLIYNCKSSAN